MHLTHPAGHLPTAHGAALSLAIDQLLIRAKNPGQDVDTLFYQEALVDGALWMGAQVAVAVDAPGAATPSWAISSINDPQPAAA